jgi:hypothetical protein
MTQVEEMTLVVGTPRKTGPHKTRMPVVETPAMRGLTPMNLGPKTETVMPE